MQLDRYPAMKRIPEEYSELENKPSDTRIGLDRNTAMKQIRGIESKPSDTRIGLDRYTAMKQIRGIESKPSDRVGSTQIEQNQMELEALKRIRVEYREIESNPSGEFMCGLLKRKKFQWQFAVRGASGTEFEGGIYHGRVLFPTEYPCKPPSIIALTENGRFKTHTEISLRRLDKWQPSYRVRDVFFDFVHLMPTPTYPDELCSLECNKEERRALAIKSRAAAPKYGTPERQKVIDQIHQYMLSKAPNGTGGGSVPSQASKGTGGVYIIGNKFCATNADRVGILGCMNEAGVGILGSVYGKFFNFGNAFHTTARGIFHSLNEAPKLPVPVPQLQLTRNTPFQEEVVVDQVGSTQMGWDRSVILEDKCNIKNSGEKRILEEYKEIESNPSYDFKCLKLDCDPYEWQFAIRGPSGTEFEGGIYHGLVQFSGRYPLKPPSITLLTKNGRFKIQTDISSRLLSNWQSPRSVRNALLALIEEIPTYPDGDEELDSVKYFQEVRHALAIKSREAAPKYGTSQRQKLIDEIHEYMLSEAPLVPQLQLSSPSQASNEHEHEHYQHYGAKRKHGIFASNPERVGISDFGAPKPMITKSVLFRVFLFSSILIGLSSILFGFWSFRG